jgi:Cft2 family RNA processing exonuclease
VPYLIAAGFRGKIYCSEASARLLPLVLDDALRMGITRDQRLIEQFLGLIDSRLVALPYGKWAKLPVDGQNLSIKLKPAGHILGSAYVECRLRDGGSSQKVIFSSSWIRRCSGIIAPAFGVSPWRSLRSWRTQFSIVDLLTPIDSHAARIV